MARMSVNDEISSRDFGDSSKLTNWVLYSGAMCHMTPQVSDFIPGSLVDTDKYVEVDDVNYVTAKQKGKIQIKMCDKTEILSSRHCTTYFWHRIFLNRLFLVIMLMNFRTYLFISQRVLNVVIQR